MAMLRFVSAVITACLLSACAAQSDPAQGSQTHFLASCDSSCPAPYDCICGVCTLSCTANAMCSDSSADATCVAASGAESCEAAGNICDVECSGDAECRAFGSAHVCESGRCREPAANEAGQGGMSAGPDSGGTSGAGTGGDAAVEAPPAPLGELCDGTTDIRLMFGTAIAFSGPPAYETLTAPYGRSFFILDGQCRYYAGSDPREGTLTGTLTAAEAEQLAADISWSMLEELSADPDPTSCPPDSGWYARAPGTGNLFTCTCGCEPGSSPLAEERSAALEALKAMMNDVIERGTALDGAVLAVAHALGTATGSELEWPIARAVLDIPSFVREAPALESGSSALYYKKPIVFEGDDAAALRALRASGDSFSSAIQVRDGGMLYQVYTRDAFPGEVERDIEDMIAGRSGDPGPIEPLPGVGDICDGSTALRLGFMREFETTFMPEVEAFKHPLGREFLFVDGQCRYYASSAYSLGIHTGTFTEREIGWLARKLEWASLPELSEIPEEPTCVDNSYTTVFAPGVRVSCACECDNGPEWARKQGAVWAPYDWTMLGMERGTPIDAPILAFAQFMQSPIVDQPAWPLARPIFEIEGFIYDASVEVAVDPVRFTDEAELEQLRGLRSPLIGDPQVVDNELLFQIVMRDEVPADLAAAIQALRDSSAP